MSPSRLEQGMFSKINSNLKSKGLSSGLDGASLSILYSPERWL